MDAIKLLRSQGFGSRNAAKYLIENDLVFINDELVSDCKKNFPNPWGLRLKVDEETLITREYVYLALHKPADYETSHRPQHHRSVFDLLPPRLLERGVQAVGRLDADTIEQAARLVADGIEPISDLRGSADYRREMVRISAKRTLQSLLQDTKEQP